MKSQCFPCNKFDDFAEEWDLLNQTTHNQAVLHSHFVKQLLQHFSQDNQYLVVTRSEAQIEFIGFFQKIGFGRWHSVMPSQAPLGLWLVYNGKLTTNILHSIAGALPGFVWQIDLLQADSRNLEFQPPIFSQFYIETGNRPVPESYSDYAASLGKNLRQNCNKAFNRAQRDNETLSSDVVTAPDQVSVGVAHFAEIESKSWKAQEGTAVSADNPQGQFYRDMMVDFARQKNACVWYFKVSSQIAAVDLCIKQGANLIILKTTFDEQYAQYSPALLLKLDMIKYYSEHPECGIRNIEFYGKAMDWHKRLHSELRNVVHLTWRSSAFVTATINVLKWLRNSLKGNKKEARV